MAKTIELTDKEAQVIGVSLAFAVEVLSRGMVGGADLLPVVARFHREQTDEEAYILAEKLNAVARVFDLPPGGEGD